MLVGNFLTAGDYMEVVPIGLPLTLKYDERGVLCGVLKGYDEDSVDISNQLLNTFLTSCNSVPNNISVKEGTTFIKGVLYTSQSFDDVGELPRWIESSIIHDFPKNHDSYNFFASTVESYAMVFRGATNIRSWLKLSRFYTLPGYIIPSELNETSFEQLVNNETFNFQYPLIAGFFVFHNDNGEYFDAGIKQTIVKSVHIYYDSVGRLLADLQVEGRGLPLIVDYSDVVKFNINAKTKIVLDNEDNIIYSSLTDNKKRAKRTCEIECPVCGRKIRVPDKGVTMCPDSHCNSQLYPGVVQFLNTLRLPYISYNRYQEIIEHDPSFEIPDVLFIDEMKDVNITVTLSDALRSIIPWKVVPKSSSMLITICNACNNTLTSLDYYLDHLDKLENDTHIEISNALKNWLSDTVNRSNLNLVLHNGKIHFGNVEQMFDGDPIFRGKRFYLTGDFVHGSHQDIEAILRSYAGEVVQDYHDDFDCILIGDTKDNMNGAAIKYAARRHLYSFMESEFFNKYEIDKDIKQNLT